VGGIGVMNIMLANIMERISEIGLRRAIGARRRDIRNQFLLESVSICSVGGILGVLLGLGASWVVSVTIGLPMAFAWESTALSFVISLLVGVTFGLMPAVRAANVNPIDALRGD
jgi:putative ABC transport system permease protein